MKNILTRPVVCLAAVIGMLMPAHAANLAAGMTTGKPEFKSMGPLAFGPGGILFIADTKSAAITAVATGDTGPAVSARALKVEGINQKIAGLLGTAADQVQINDLTVNPASRNAYLAVSRGRGADAIPVLIRVNADGVPEAVSLDKVKFSRAELPHPPADQEAGRRGNPRMESITDLAYVEGRVIVAGLSNEEFQSTLRDIPFPFESIPGGATIEIYHGAHGAYETRSPIRTFVPFKIGGEPQLLAAYTCTPLVQLPLRDLKPGAKVKGKTIAELGNRNRPLDMIVYDKSGETYLLMANSSRGVMKIGTGKIAEAGSITSRVADKEGLPYETIADWTNIEQLDQYDATSALVLRRNESGAMNLEALPLP